MASSPAESETQKPGQARPPADSEEGAPLSLAESSEGSTLPVDTAKSPVGDPVSSGGPAGGTSSVGFETMLGKLIVRGGLATDEEVELCHALQREATESDDPRTLGDLLIEN